MSSKSEPLVPADGLVIRIGVGSAAAGHPGGIEAVRGQRLVLVDADTGVIEELARVAPGNGVELRCSAVSGADATRTLYLCNIPSANSLNPPTGMRELYPGLKVIEERRVQTIAVSTLLEDVDLSGSGRNRLVLDVGGEERAILDALRRSSLLDKFHVVEVRCGEIALFESSMTVSELRRWMTEAGFAYRSRDDSLDPDLPLLTFDLSADRHEARLLQSELKATKDALQNQREVNSRLEAELEVSSKAAAKSASLSERLDEMTLEARRRGERVTEMEKKLADMTIERDSLKVERDTLQQNLDDLKTRLESAERDASQSGRRQQMLDEELVRAEAQLDLIADVLIRDKLL